MSTFNRRFVKFFSGVEHFSGYVHGQVWAKATHAYPHMESLCPTGAWKGLENKLIYRFKLLFSIIFAISSLLSPKWLVGSLYSLTPPPQNSLFLVWSPSSSHLKTQSHGHPENHRIHHMTPQPPALREWPNSSTFPMAWGPVLRMTPAPWLTCLPEKAQGCQENFLRAFMKNGLWLNMYLL